MDQETTIAFHEAGHAVVATKLKARVTEASIAPSLDGESLGHVHLHYMDTGAEKCEKEILVLLAGSEAERRLHGPDYDPAGGAEDRKIIRSLAIELWDCPSAAALWVRRLRKRVRRMLARPEVWQAVSLVARQLCRKKTLRGWQILDLCRRARRRAKP